jgi:uncharacterized membrane protein
MNVKHIVMMICGIICAVLTPVYLLSYAFGTEHDPAYLAAGIMSGFTMLATMLVDK